MKQNLTLTITSLLSILLMTFHMTHDTLRARAGTAEARGLTFILVPILVVWLYGTLLLAERRSGHIIMLVGSLLASLMVVVHTRGPGDVVSGEFAKSAGAFLFVWTLMALGVTGVFSVILSVRGLWSLRRTTPG
jgi:hypothetical protein